MLFIIFTQLLDLLGGWPLVVEEVNKTATSSWNLGSAVLSLHKLRAFPLFSVHVGVDDRNSSLNIINVRIIHLFSSSLTPASLINMHTLYLPHQCSHHLAATSQFHNFLSRIIPMNIKCRPNTAIL